MRRQDKLKVIIEANLMLENSYLKSKGLIKEDEGKMELKPYVESLVKEHNLIMVPNPIEKSDLANMFKSAKGNLNGKSGVIAINKNGTEVLTLCLDKRLNEVIHTRFKKDWEADNTFVQSKGWSINSDGSNMQGFDYNVKPEDAPKGEGNINAYYSSFKFKR